MGNLFSLPGGSLPQKAKFPVLPQARGSPHTCLTHEGQLPTTGGQRHVTEMASEVTSACLLPVLRQGRGTLFIYGAPSLSQLWGPHSIH